MTEKGFDDDNSHMAKRTGDMVQIINGKGDFMSGGVEGDNGEIGESVVDFLESRKDFLVRGHDYGVVAVLGAQSSGKSTLLNALFGMHFQVLSQESGRQRTTHGVWLGIAPHAPRGEVGSLLVLDVEGTDGNERQDELSFERKSSLFSLAVSSVLIVNIWFQDVGRYNAANLSLLKTVFDINLQLFGKESESSRTLILFVIRDHVKTPLESLKATLMCDLQKVWNSLQKPEGLKEKELSDYFDIDFAALPHLILDPEGFDREMKNLRSRFLDPTTRSPLEPDSPEGSGWLLSPAHRKGIPADGFCQFTQTIWEVIKQNKDLDLPSQRHMLATYRCEEMSESTWNGFMQEVHDLFYITVEADGDIVQDYGKKAETLLKKWLDKYRIPASRYLREVSKKKGEELENKMRGELLRLFRLQVNAAVISTTHFLEDLLRNAMQPLSASHKKLRKRKNREVDEDEDDYVDSDEEEKEAAAISSDVIAEEKCNRDCVLCGKMLSQAAEDVKKHWTELTQSLMLPRAPAPAATATTSSPSPEPDRSLPSPRTPRGGNPLALASKNQDESSWSVALEQDRLYRMIDSRVFKAREEAMSLIVSQMKMSIRKQLDDVLGPLLDDAPADMWAKIRSLVDEISARMQRLTSCRIIEGFHATPQELQNIERDLKAYVHTVLRSSIRDKGRFLAFTMEKSFHRSFSVDKNGLPRRWKPADDIPALFFAARDKAEMILDLYAYLRLKSCDDCIHIFGESEDCAPLPDGSKPHRRLLDKPKAFPKKDPGAVATVESSHKLPHAAVAAAASEEAGGIPRSVSSIELRHSTKKTEGDFVAVRASCILLSSDECRIYLDQFRRQAETSYMEALREQEHVTIASHIPPWVFIMMAVLGWNEILFLFKHPLLLLAAVFIGLCVFLCMKFSASHILTFMGSFFTRLIVLPFQAVRDWFLAYAVRQVEARKREQERDERLLRAAKEREVELERLQTQARLRKSRDELNELVSAQHSRHIEPRKKKVPQIGRLDLSTPNPRISPSAPSTPTPAERRAMQQQTPLHSVRNVGDDSSNLRRRGFSITSIARAHTSSDITQEEEEEEEQISDNNNSDDGEIVIHKAVPGIIVTDFDGNEDEEFQNNSGDDDDEIDDDEALAFVQDAVNDGSGFEARRIIQ